MIVMENMPQQSCPRCGSANIKARRSGYFFTAGIILIGMFFVTAFFVPPLGIGGVLLGSGLLLYAPFAKGIYQCQKCRKFWKVKSE